MKINTLFYEENIRSQRGFSLMHLLPCGLTSIGGEALIAFVIVAPLIPYGHCRVNPDKAIDQAKLPTA